MYHATVKIVVNSNDPIEADKEMEDAMLKIGFHRQGEAGPGVYSGSSNMLLHELTSYIRSEVFPKLKCSNNNTVVASNLQNL